MMTQTEILSLIAYLSRAGLVQPLEGQAPVWATALDGITLDDARQAVLTMVATRTSRDRWVTPGDLREAVAAIHATRRSEGQAVDWVPDADPDDPAAYIRALREQRVRRTLDENTRPVAQIVESLADRRRPPSSDVA